jgi:hypothetical protein
VLAVKRSLPLLLMKKRKKTNRAGIFIFRAGKME